MVQLVANLKRAAFGISVMILAGFTAYTLAEKTGVVRAVAAPCIVTIFGHQYDVSGLQSTHSGGNVFVCGTDMTATYQAQHGTDVSRIASFLIQATPTPTLTATVTATPTPTPSVSTTVKPTPTAASSVSDDDQEENEHEEEGEREEEKSEEHLRIRAENTVRLGIGISAEAGERNSDDE